MRHDIFQHRVGRQDQPPRKREIAAAEQLPQRVVVSRTVMRPTLRRSAAIISRRGAEFAPRQIAAGNRSARRQEVPAPPRRGSRRPRSRPAAAGARRSTRRMRCGTSRIGTLSPSASKVRGGSAVSRACRASARFSSMKRHRARRRAAPRQHQLDRFRLRIDAQRERRARGDMRTRTGTSPAHNFICRGRLIRNGELAGMRHSMLVSAPRGKMGWLTNIFSARAPDRRR